MKIKMNKAHIGQSVYHYRNPSKVGTVAWLLDTPRMHVNGRLAVRWDDLPKIVTIHPVWMLHEKIEKDFGGTADVPPCMIQFHYDN